MHRKGAIPKIIFPAGFGFQYPILSSSIKIKITSMNYKVLYDMTKWHPFKIIAFAVP
jgi:hypothetical protein